MNTCIFHIFSLVILDLFHFFVCFLFVLWLLLWCHVFPFAKLEMCLLSFHDLWSFHLKYMFLLFCFLRLWFSSWHVPISNKFSSFLLAWKVFILPLLLKHNSRLRVIFFKHFSFGFYYNWEASYLFNYLSL